MKEIIITKEEAADQVHINTAYAHIREAMTELVQIRHLDTELARTLHSVQNSEETLYQYVATLNGVKVV